MSHRAMSQQMAGSAMSVSCVVLQQSIPRMPPTHRRDNQGGNGVGGGHGRYHTDMLKSVALLLNTAETARSPAACTMPLTTVPPLL